METTVRFFTHPEHVNHDVQSNAAHCVSVIVDVPGNYALLECTSREALFELGRTFMHEALYGSGELELYPLIVEGKAHVVNGVRLPEQSARLFVHFPKSGAHEL